MIPPGFVLQSVVIDDRSVQVSYYLEEEKDSLGVMVRTAAITPLAFQEEVEELFDSVYQLITAWEGARREAAAQPR